MVATPSPIPRALIDIDHWVCWKLQRDKNGKPTKVPKSPHGGPGSSTNPTTWGTFAEAELERVRRRYDGIGFVLWKGRAPDTHLNPKDRHAGCPGVDARHFMPGDPPADDIVGVDMDHCLNGSGAKAWASESVVLLDSYSEVTPSGEGLRVFARGALPAGDRKVGDLEMYEADRFLTVTGRHLEGTPLTLEERTEQIKTVHARMAQGVAKPAEPSGHTLTSKQSRMGPPDNDEDLLRLAFNAKDGGKFSQLWVGSNAGFPSPSEGDLSLCNALAYWTEGDASRMDRLFRQSKRFRDKWDDVHGTRTIGERTIATALESYRARFPGGMKATPPEQARPTDPGIGIRPLSELMAEDLPPAEHVIPDWLQTGLVILAGKPKIGKSWMMLAAALAVANGKSTALGRLAIEKPSPVLYLALEDPKRRLQDRVHKILGPGAPIPPSFDYSLTCPKLGEGGVEFIDAWLEGKPAGCFVVVDIWKRVKPKPDKGANAYDADYDAAILLQSLAIRRRACIVLLHHTNKIKSDDDTDIISGSIGFSGAADEIMVLLKAGKKNAVLRGSGRDVTPFDWALEWSVDAASWTIIGSPEEEEESREQRETVEAVQEFGRHIKPGDLATALNIKYDAAKKRLYRAAKRGALVSLNDGTYYTTPVPPVPAVPDVPPVPQSLIPGEPRGQAGQLGQRDSQDSQDRQNANSSNVFAIVRCRGSCGSYLKGSEQAAGICRSCERQEVEAANAEPF